MQLIDVIEVQFFFRITMTFLEVGKPGCVVAQVRGFGGLAGICTVQPCRVSTYLPEEQRDWTVSYLAWKGLSSVQKFPLIDMCCIACEKEGPPNFCTNLDSHSSAL